MKDNSELHDTIREVKDAVDFEEEKRNLQNIEKDLTTDMQIDDINLDEFNRPNFGGDPKNLEETHGSPFRQAPAQPQIPGSDSAAAQSPEPAPAHNASSAATQQADTNQPQATTSAKERTESAASTNESNTENTASAPHSEPSTSHKS